MKGLQVGRLSQPAQQYRHFLNNAAVEDMPSHPTPATAKKFRLKDNLFMMNLAVDREQTYVKTVSDLLFCVNILKNAKQIAVDIESDNNFNFLSITSAIQITTCDHDFFIDSIKLYDKIECHLKPIFLDKNIVKIFFGTQDLMGLQRDFRIFCNSVIDVQHVIKERLSLVMFPSLAEAVKKYLDRDIDLQKEKYQRFPWRMRELPQTAIDYALEDSHLLYLLWEMIKCTELEFLENYSDKFVNDRVIAKYSFPKIRHLKRFNLCMRLESVKLRNELKFQDHFFLFKDLLDFALAEARKKDFARKKILCFNELVNLSIMRPRRVEEVKLICSRTEKWNVNLINDLIGIICNFVKPVIQVTIKNEYVIDSDSDEDLNVVIEGNSREISVKSNDKTENEIVSTIENIELMEVDNDNDNLVNNEMIKVNKYDNLSNEDIDKILNDNLVNDWEIILKSNLKGSQKNYLRTKKNLYLYGVKRICSKDKRKGNCNARKFRGNFTRK